MLQKKNTHSKELKSKSIHESPSRETEDTKEVVAPKIKRLSVEPELPEDVLPVVEEKNDDESSTSEDAEDSADEVSLDDEELNPFGDKWEQ